jgi:hypothetical protein
MTSTNQNPTNRPALPVRTAQGVLRLLAVLAILAGAAVLLLTAYVLKREAAWLPPPSSATGETEDQKNERAFFHGTIGTEIAPLPVLQVLPEICAGDSPPAPDHFRPLGPEAGEWADQFGFLPASLAPASPSAANGLPLGFTVSHYRPKSGAPSAVMFVGLACAACHTTRINGKLVVGTGNTSLNLFAWIDAFQASLRDKRVTYQSLLTACQDRQGNAPLPLEQKAMIWLWLNGARAKQAEDVTKYDEPFGGGLSMRPEYVPTGPCRTQPFRTLVRTLLQRPGSDMKVYTKIAAVYQEQPEEWGQFDGGIHGLYPRSAGAALAAGATPQNMSLPEIADNIKWASDYITSRPGPTWDEIFPEKPVDRSRAEAGKKVYLAYCDCCHGHLEGAQWEDGKLVGQLTPLAEVKTDPERVSFRYYEEVADAISVAFPKNHPFQFPRDGLRPKHQDDPTQPIEKAYINKRMHSMFSRAPFLHNASVLTLAELIHLEVRRPVFFRGANDYDAQLVGLMSPSEKEHDPKDHKLYFRFDTALPGNSNKGHDYPWTRDEVEKDPKKQGDLRALLEYLKKL